jgi:hypothetical protein
MQLAHEAESEWPRSRPGPIAARNAEHVRWAQLRLVVFQRGCGCGGAYGRAKPYDGKQRHCRLSKFPYIPCTAKRLHFAVPTLYDNLITAIQ